MCLLHKIYIRGESCPVRPYQLPPHQCQKCWRFVHPAKHCCSKAICLLCAQPGHHCTYANCGGSHIIFNRNCHASKFESEVVFLYERPDRKHLLLIFLLPLFPHSLPTHSILSFVTFHYLVPRNLPHTSYIANSYLPFCIIPSLSTCLFHTCPS